MRFGDASAVQSPDAAPGSRASADRHQLKYATASGGSWRSLGFEPSSFSHLIFNLDFALASRSSNASRPLWQGSRPLFPRRYSSTSSHVFLIASAVQSPGALPGSMTSADRHQLKYVTSSGVSLRWLGSGPTAFLHFLFNSDFALPSRSSNLSRLLR